MSEWNIYLKEPFAEGAGEWLVTEGDPGPGYDGITNAGSETVVIRPVSSDDYERRIALHELGHVIGLNHSASRKDVMSGTGVEVEHISPDDLEACRAIGKCN